MIAEGIYLFMLFVTHYKTTTSRLTSHDQDTFLTLPDLGSETRRNSDALLPSSFLPRRLVPIGFFYRHAPRFVVELLLSFQSEKWLRGEPPRTTVFSSTDNNHGGLTVSMWLLPLAPDAVRLGFEDNPMLRRRLLSSVIVGLFTAPFVSRGRMEHLWDLFYRRPPPVVSRGESQPPPLKLLGATSVSVRLNVPFSYSPAYEVF
ncbi:hypothetical protein F2Q70_00010137 [Brassica cretica]|uniref:Uncharacterized protein n=1 Tax=Brassica cretica TaxID=69181 RepID=A0A8S9JDA3_BRACR|nr:hypothetical protein F2Q68_00003144 [Brassica cretica]KAF2615645.1 hypothetical protein F2Q70_00010137 [Brassica cretica]